MGTSDISHVVVVRHACAGDKQTWAGDDADRPLDDGGVEQSLALVDALAGSGVQRLMASPTARCTQTLQPLAGRMHVPIERSELLRPDGSIVSLLEGRWASLAGAVMCTHGELMLPLLADLRERGARIVAERLDEGWLLMKGSLWDISVDAEGRPVELRHQAPLPLPECGSHVSSD